MKHAKEIFETPCTLTGELFPSRAKNHFEENDGIPVAPPVEYNRPTIRQRVENLLNRNVDLLANYVGSEDYDMEVPDDPEAPLTFAEQNYIEAVAASLAENAPLPDDNIPRKSETPPQAPQPAPEQVSSPAPAPNPAP